MSTLSRSSSGETPTATARLTRGAWAAAGLLCGAALVAGAWIARVPGAPAIVASGRATVADCVVVDGPLVLPPREARDPRVLAHEPASLEDITRLRLTALDAEGASVSPAWFEVTHVQTSAPTTSFVPERTLAFGEGPTTTIDLPSTVLGVEVTASAAGHRPGRVTLTRLRHLGGRYRATGVVEREVVVGLDAPRPGRFVEGRVLVDGRPGAPADLELTLKATMGAHVPGADLVVDRATDSYRLGPLVEGRLWVHAVAQGVAPLWLEVPRTSDQGDVWLDVAFESGRSISLEVVDVDSGVPLPFLPMRVDISIPTWRTSEAAGESCRPAVMRSDARGRLVVGGLPEGGRIAVGRALPPRETADGRVLVPPETQFEHHVRSDDPAQLHGVVRVAGAGPPRCVLWGHRPRGLEAPSDGELVLTLADVDGPARVTRTPLGEAATWEVEVEPAEGVRVWLERAGRRVSDVQALAAPAYERRGPLDFTALSTTPVELTWSGAQPGDRVRVESIGGAVDEELACFEVEPGSAAHTIPVSGPSTLAILLEREDGCLSVVRTCDPERTRGVHADWSSAERAELELDIDGLGDLEGLAVLLIPLDSSASSSRLSRVGSRRAAVWIEPGTYFFRVEGPATEDSLCGVTRYASGDGVLGLRWRGCAAELDDQEVVLQQIEGYDLSSVSTRLRSVRVGASPRIGAESLRPRSVRLPCGSKWSPQPKPVPTGEL